MSKPSNYNDFPEIISITQAAKLVKISRLKFTQWIHTGQTPMGELREGYHYYRDGIPYKIIKSRLCELFGIGNTEETKANNDLIDKECLEIAEKIMKLSLEKRLAIKILIE
jgi:hypothetical protein